MTVDIYFLNFQKMRREYSTWTSEDSTAFIGNEVECTMFKGLKTLFIPLEIWASIQGGISVKADKMKEMWIEHLYIGANHTYYKDQAIEIIQQVIERADWLKMTLEIPPENFDDIVDIPHSENLCIVLSVRVKNVEARENLYIKIDDVDFNASNSGVWVAPVGDIMLDKNKTTWEAYSKDILL